MQIALKSMNKFADCDINTLAEETTHLQLTGAKSIFQGSHSPDAVNVDNPTTTITSKVLESIVITVVKKLSHRNLSADTGGSKDYKPRVNFSNTLPRNSSNKFREKYRNSANYRNQ